MTESTRAKITTVVFDVGNVLVGWSAHLALADRMSEEQWNEQALAADFVALNALTDRGVAIAEVVRLASERDPAHGELEAIMVSGGEGLAKPDPEIFERMIDIYGLAPEQTVFIDDTVENVAAASDLGFISLLFTDTKRLREDLRGLGALR